MDFFDTDIQIEESYGFYDDEETLRQVNSYYDEYDDLAFGLPLDSANDF